VSTDPSKERPPPRWERLSPMQEAELINQARLKHFVPVREPLVLISQIPRSGGTLLSQLFDGHPECHAHPHEIWIGHPSSAQWPPLDLRKPDEWFSTLYEKKAIKHAQRGYRKAGSREVGVEDVFPFLFSARLQKQIFDVAVDAGQVRTERDVLNAYFTSYFNAWLDNHNLYTGPKRAVTGFTPGLATRAANVEGFFSAYPDGFLVSIVRDPRSWFASARKHSERYTDVEQAIPRWRRSAEAALEAAERHSGRVSVLTYEQLVGDTAGVMTSLAQTIGIAFDPVLLMPTFNGRPIRANSHHEVAEFGVLADRRSMYRSLLEPETIQAIDRAAGDLYERARVVAEASRPPFEPPRV
jgi:Sulfotransferase family